MSLLNLQEGVEGGVEMAHCTRLSSSAGDYVFLREWPAFYKMSCSWWVMGKGSWLLSLDCEGKYLWE